MTRPSIDRRVSHGVTLLGDTSRPGGVTFAFTERTGGVSKAPYASLNLGDRCGDDPAAVAENRSRALAALGLGRLADRLVCPRQVHGDHLVTIASNDPAALEAARAEALAGADGVVCGAAGVPVLMCFADCVPVVLCAPGAFAVVHSGWRGTIARICAKAVRALTSLAGCAPSELSVYVGPHVSGEDYEVSPELLARFEGEFGSMVRVPGTERNLSLSAAVAATLADAGVPAERVVDSLPSTASHLSRFYSYRAEEGLCGRHAAIACL